MGVLEKDDNTIAASSETGEENTSESAIDSDVEDDSSLARNSNESNTEDEFPKDVTAFNNSAKKKKKKKKKAKKGKGKNEEPGVAEDTGGSSEPFSGLTTPTTEEEGSGATSEVERGGATSEEERGGATSEEARETPSSQLGATSGSESSRSNKSNKKKNKKKKDRSTGSPSGSDRPNSSRRERKKAAEHKKKEDQKEHKKGQLLTSSELFKKCIDHLRNHPDKMPTPHLNRTLKLVCGNGNEEKANQMVKDFQKGKPVTNPRFQEIVHRRLPSRFHSMSDSEAGEPRMVELMYQTSLDLYLLSSAQNFSNFVKEIYRQHADTLLQSASQLPSHMQSTWEKLKMATRLQASLQAINSVHASDVWLDEFSELSEDLLEFVEKLHKEKVGNCYKYRPRMGIKTLYYSFLVPERDELQEPFLTTDSTDKRLRRVELACHCRINVSQETAPGIPSGYLLVEVYYDFIYGNHLGAKDMLQRLLFSGPDVPRIPNRHYRTVLCYPSGETIVFQDMSWLQAISLKKTDTTPNLNYLHFSENQYQHCYGQHFSYTD